MINITKTNGKKTPLDISKIRNTLLNAKGDIDGVDILEVERDSHLIFTDGMTTKEIQRTLKQTVNDKIRVESPNYTFLGAGLELQDMYKEAGKRAKYRPLSEVVNKGIYEGLYLPILSSYDLDLLDKFIITKNDRLFNYYGVRTFKDRYAIHDKKGKLLELPQHAMMRVAMAVSVEDFNKGWLSDELISEVQQLNPMLSIKEVYRHCWVISFYRAFSEFKLSGSTPIWSNAGTPYGMLIACFVGTIPDTLEGRTRSDHNFAISSSYGGGVGDDVTDVRANGGRLRNFKEGANGTIPMIKTQQGYAMQYNQAGTRSGSHAISIVPYHLDLFDFIELKKQSGEEARRVKGKGIYPSLFFPDLFFKRLLKGESWTLFDPQDVPDLNECWGDEFEKKYEAYEKRKDIRKKVVDTYETFKKIIVELDATGAPFILFRDSFNRRNPQAHDGIIKSSQLCVVPETKILTKDGYKEIVSCLGTQEVWNGKEWSQVEVKKTGSNSEILKVSTTGGSLECTPYHKFYIQVGSPNRGGKVIEKRAYELCEGDRLIKFDLPTINGNKILPFPYENGFYTGDGCLSSKPLIYLYHGKQELLSKFNNLDKVSVIKNTSENRTVIRVQNNQLQTKYFVPSSEYTIKSRLDWLAGLLDADGCVTNNRGTQSIQITQVNTEFLTDVSLMLQELGVHSKVVVASNCGMKSLPKNDKSGGKKDYYCKPTKRLLIAETGLQKLLSLGLELFRLKVVKRTPNRDAKAFIKVLNVENQGRISDTYCFTEEKRHMGMFNGILTGQCTEIGVVAKPSKFLGYDYDEETNISTEKWDLGKTNICCLASQNLARLKTKEELAYNTKLGIRMLDNVISINKYVTPETYKAGMEDRNIGLGVMGEMEALASKGLYFGSKEHEEYINEVYQAIDFNAISASSDLAKERGVYKTYKGSSWSKGILTAELGTNTILKDTDDFAWDKLRSKVNKQGMRNANLTAPAPTGTISTLFGTTPCIEPVFKRRYIEEARNGDAIAVTAPNISIDNYQQYQPAEEVSQEKVIEMASFRQRWITQSQSLNIFKPIDGNFEDLMSLYILAWRLGVKGTYYLKNRSKVSASNNVETKISEISCAGCD